MQRRKKMREKLPPKTARRCTVVLCQTLSGKDAGVYVLCNDHYDKLKQMNQGPTQEYYVLPIGVPHSPRCDWFDNGIQCEGYKEP